jgi:ferric-dicitrate binding protein FerR (iron transport regulator)
LTSRLRTADPDALPDVRWSRGQALVVTVDGRVAIRRRGPRGDCRLLDGQRVGLSQTRIRVESMAPDSGQRDMWHTRSGRRSGD